MTWDPDRGGSRHDGSRKRHIRRDGEQVTLVNTTVEIDRTTDWDDEVEIEDRHTTWAIVAKGRSPGQVRRGEVGEEPSEAVVFHLHETLLADFDVTDGINEERRATAIERESGAVYTIESIEPRRTGVLEVAATRA